jgi:hypothetical protein
LMRAVSDFSVDTMCYSSSQEYSCGEAILVAIWRISF